MQFLSNKYTKIYFDIIQNAQKANRVKHRSTHIDYIYYEKHHIIPRSLSGNDDNENLVLLTAREHFICHYLLCKMVNQNACSWHKVVRAFTFMYASSNGQQRYFNSKLYASARKNIGKVMSIAQSGEKNSQFGTMWVSNVATETCLRINNSDLDEYVKNGFTPKRIINWQQYQKKQNDKILKQQNKIKAKIAKIDEKINQLLIEKEELSSSSYLCLRS